MFFEQSYSTFYKKKGVRGNLNVFNAIFLIDINITSLRYVKLCIDYCKYIKIDMILLVKIYIFFNLTEPYLNNFLIYKRIWD